MQPSARAQGILDQFARDQGLKTLRLGPDGTIPIGLGADLAMAIGYDAANDAFDLFAVLDPNGDGGLADPWWAFRENAELAGRRTRLALEPSTGALVVIAEVLLGGLDFPAFNARLDRFVRDVRDLKGRYPGVGAAGARGAADAGASGADAGSDFVTFRA